MTIKARLTASFLLFFCLAGASVGLAGLGLLKSIATMDTLIHRDFAYVRAGERLIAAQLEFDVALHNYVTSEAADERKDFATEMEDLRKEQADIIAGLLTTIDELGAEKLQFFQSLESTASQAADEAIRLADQGDTPAALGLLTTASRSALLDVKVALIDFRDGYADLMSTASDEAAEEARLTMMRLAALIVAALVIGTIASVNVMLRISRGLKQALALSQRVAAGDLGETAVVKGRDEFSRLLEANNAMVLKLREIVTSVSAAAAQLTGGGMRIAENSRRLSMRASEQADSTGTASASVEEMAASIRQTADNAGQTERMASNAATDAAQGGRAVVEAADAMQVIADRILVLQEIARRTDLLALNAAVEAARAGEHGRGFAVVAAEVRKLAESSRSAAIEVSDLSRSTAAVAGRANDTIARLVPEIERTSGFVSEISEASRELTTGAQQVATAIERLDDATRQNFSASEELASEADRLLEQARVLDDVIAYFRLGDAASLAADARASSTYEAPDTSSTSAHGNERFPESPQSRAA